MSACSIPSSDIVLSAAISPSSVFLDVLAERLALRLSSSKTGSREMAMLSIIRDYKVYKVYSFR